MADSLLFDASSRIRFSVGSAGIAPPACYVAIVKTATDDLNVGVLGVGAAATQANVLLAIYGTPHRANIGLIRPGSTDGYSPLLLEIADGWTLVAGQKTSGTTTPRFHRYEYGTATWTHDDSAAGTMGDWSTATGQVGIGERGNGAEQFFGNILIAGVWSSTFADAAFEALGLQNGLQAWVTAAPVEAWRLDTMSTIDSFAGGTSAETSRVGTSLDTGDVPAGWNDSLSVTPVTPSYRQHPKIRLRTPA